MPRKIPTPKPHPPVSINLYRNLALGFTVLVAILFLTVLAVTLARAEILVAPKDEILNFDLVFDVGEAADGDSALRGAVAETIERKEKSIAVSGGEVWRDARATGKVILYNRRPTPQALVATTRLLSKEAVLFRLSNRLIIPAGGSIETSVYADKEGPSGNIGPTTFTVPGLPAAAQSQVFVESKESMSGGQVSVTALTQEDLTRGYEEVKAEILESAKNIFMPKLAVLGDNLEPQYVYSSETLEESADSQVGREVSKFKVSATLHIAGVSFGKIEFLRKLYDNIKTLLPASRELLPLKLEDLNVAIDSVDTRKNTAKLKVGLAARTRFTAKSAELDKKLFFGLTRDEVELRLRAIDGVRDFKIKMPFFMGRIPKDEGRVRVIVE